MFGDKRLTICLCVLLTISLVSCKKTDTNESTKENLPSIEETSLETTLEVPDTTKAVSTETIAQTVIETTSEEIIDKSNLEVHFIGNQKYAGQSLLPSELEIIATLSDGTVQINPDGWVLAEIWSLLEPGDNTYTVYYGDMEAKVVINALNETPSGNTICDVNIASDLSYNGHEIVSLGLEYLNISMNSLGILSPFSGHVANSASFVRLIYGKIGLALPYDLSEQMTYGEEITKEELKVGDLVFINAPTKDDTLITDESDEIILAGIYLGGDWVLSCAESGVADIYWLNPVTCRRIFHNTCEVVGEDAFKTVMRAFAKQGEYGKWVASYIDDVPFMIGRVRRFTFTVNLLEYEDGYYKTYFSYDDFLLPESFVKQWQKQFLKKNALCEVMKNGEYVRYDEEGNYYFKIDVTPQVWATLTPGIHGEYWNLDFNN